MINLCLGKEKELILFDWLKDIFNLFDLNHFSDGFLRRAILYLDEGVFNPFGVCKPDYGVPGTVLEVFGLLLKGPLGLNSFPAALI